MVPGDVSLHPIVRAFVFFSSVACCLGANPDIHFNRDIRPILSENCYACHGPDKNQRKAKLRLDVREVALEREAIIPGKPDESKLIQHVFSRDPEEVMPPPKSQKTLTVAQKELLKQWVAAGAPYESHWAYILPRRAPLPDVTDQRWVRNPIDAFILHALEAKNIRPSPEADKRTLLRRLSLDLIGLPPSPLELNTFLKDKSPKAYERQVDRLLNSPHFGERMAVPWLDVVRFADTVGYHGDQNQNIFPYRDYVIDAFNRNKPFDQFTIEQIAGDLLESPSLDAQVASGFNRLNMMTREGGAQPKEYLAKYAADRVRTVSMAWLGSTMGCAECHDHKFDPFSTKDFYSMEAFFADIKQWGVYADYSYTPEPELKGIGNDHPFLPEIELNNPYLEKRIEKLRRQAEQIYAQAVAKLSSNKIQQKDLAAWKESSLSFLKQSPTGWVTPLPEVMLKMKDTNAVAQTNFTVQMDGTVLLSSEAKSSTKLTLPLADIWISAIRLEITPQESSTSDDKGVKKRSRTSISLSASHKAQGVDHETKLTFYAADADHKEERYSGGRPIIGVKDTWQISIDRAQQTAVWLLEKPIETQDGDQLILNLGGANVASVRVSLSPFPGDVPLASGRGEALRKSIVKAVPKAGAARNLAMRTYLLTRQFDSAEIKEIRKLSSEIRSYREGQTFSTLTVARELAVTRVLPRGNFLDQSGEIVQPATPHFLPPIANPTGGRLTRLDLAHWLVSPENPLTARAVVNRFWKQFFGTGLSAVVDDLGAQGDWPVHPELLDWLACEFRDGPSSSISSTRDPSSVAALRRVDTRHSTHPWNVKHIIKLMVMSSTYRQESNLRPDLKEIDPNNRLLAFEPPRRLEAEFVRDNALFIAGLLNLDIGGPSAHPYQPAGYYVNLQFPDRDYFPERDDRQYRRGLYTHWQRTFLHPMMANFDAPSREECTAIRVVSNTPQQALTLLNDPSFVEAARVFAANLLAPANQNDEQRLNAAFERALARLPNNREKQSLLNFLTEQRGHYSQDSDEASQLQKVGFSKTPENVRPEELAAWTQVCRVILNLQETVTRY
jgi:hypothetical protein